MTGENPIADAIDGAGDVRDPLDALIDRAAAEPGAPFTSDALAMLASLKKSDRATFESVRARLKAAGCRVAALDVAIAEAECERQRAVRPSCASSQEPSSPTQSAIARRTRGQTTRIAKMPSIPPAIASAMRCCFVRSVEATTKSVQVQSIARSRGIFRLPARECPAMPVRTRYRDCARRLSRAR
jgi:hypothetical protein